MCALSDQLVLCGLDSEQLHVKLLFRHVAQTACLRLYSLQKLLFNDHNHRDHATGYKLFAPQARESLQSDRHQLDLDETNEPTESDCEWGKIQKTDLCRSGFQ